MACRQTGLRSSPGRGSRGLGGQRQAVDCRTRAGQAFLPCFRTHVQAFRIDELEVGQADESQKLAQIRGLRVRFRIVAAAPGDDPSLRVASAADAAGPCRLSSAAGGPRGAYPRPGGRGVTVEMVEAGDRRVSALRASPILIDDVGTWQELSGRLVRGTRGEAAGYDPERARSRRRRPSLSARQAWWPTTARDP